MFNLNINSLDLSENEITEKSCDTTFKEFLTKDFNDYSGPEKNNRFKDFKTIKLAKNKEIGTNGFVKMMLNLKQNQYIKEIDVSDCGIELFDEYLSA